MNAKEIRKTLISAGIPVWKCRTMTRSTGSEQLIGGVCRSGSKFNRIELVIENSADRDRALTLLADAGAQVDRRNYSPMYAGTGEIVITLV